MLAITWFATTFLSLQSLLNEYQALRRMCCSQEWIHWKDSTKPDAVVVKLSLLGDGLWEKVTEIVNFIEPLVKVLRIMDGEKPKRPSMRAWIGPKRPSRLSIRGIHQNTSLYGRLLIPGGTGSYIHHCMQQEHISIQAYSIIQTLTFKVIMR